MSWYNSISQKKMLVDQAEEWLRVSVGFTNTEPIQSINESDLHLRCHHSKRVLLFFSTSWTVLTLLGIQGFHSTDTKSDVHKSHTHWHTNTARERGEGKGGGAATINDTRITEHWPQPYSSSLKSHSALYCYWVSACVCACLCSWHVLCGCVCRCTHKGQKQLDCWGWSGLAKERKRCDSKCSLTTFIIRAWRECRWGG